MTVDKDRKIVAIKYNLLNLPDVIQFSNGNQIKNRYSADGRKLGTEYFTQLTTIQPLAEGTILNQVYQANVVDQTGTAYVGNYEYKTYWGLAFYNTLKKVFNSEGYVDEYSNNQSYSGYVYYRKDHLGNNREVWRAGKPGGASATTLQRTWYYPSGLPWNYTTGTGASVQPYKYNGKEFIEMHGFDTYDYGARGYYPALGRFMTIDPMAEKYYSISPYAYCAGNPILYVDPDGRKRIKLEIFRLAGTSGFIGGGINVLGVGIGFNQTLGGGLKDETSFYVLYDTNKKQFGVGVSKTKTEFLNSTEVQLDNIKGGSSDERSEIFDVNTIDGDKGPEKETTYQDKEHGGLYGVDVESETGEISTGIELKVNLGIGGIEIGPKLKIYDEPESNNTNNVKK